MGNSWAKPDSKSRNCKTLRLIAHSLPLEAKGNQLKPTARCAERYASDEMGSPILPACKRVRGANQRDLPAESRRARYQQAPSELVIVFVSF